MQVDFTIIRRGRQLLKEFVATLKQAGLMLDFSAANAHLGPWLQEVANQHRHGTSDEISAIRLQQELPLFLPRPPAGWYGLTMVCSGSASGQRRDELRGLSGVVAAGRADHADPKAGQPGVYRA